MANESQMTEDIMNTTYDAISWYQPASGGEPPIYAITRYHMYPIVVIGRIVHIMWYIIGMIGNLVSINIWIKARMKKVNTSAFYLVSITFCDMSFHILHFFFYLKYFWGVPSIDHPGLCQIWNVLNLIPQYASQLLVLGFTIERLISIIKPFHAERFSRHHRAPKVVVGLFVFVILISIPQGIFWTVNESGFCDISDKTLQVYDIWTIVTESILFLVIPVISLIMNIIMLRFATVKINNHEVLQTNGRISTRAIRKGLKPVTKTHICISLFRIITQLPVSITYTIHNLPELQFGSVIPLEEFLNNPQKVTFIRYWGARMIIEIFGASHHALSVLIFYASTEQFRSECLKIIRRVRTCFASQKGF